VSNKIITLSGGKHFPQRQTQGFDGNYLRSLENNYRSHNYNQYSLLREEFNPLDFFRRSLNYNRRQRIPSVILRRFSKEIPIKRAISKITNVVLSMAWDINPKLDFKNSIDPEEQKVIKKAIKKAISEPNREEHNTYHDVVCSIIESLLTIGFAAVERQDGGEDYKEQPFWWWDVDGALIERNPDWNATKNNVPRYFERDLFDQKVFRSINDEHLFIITLTSNSHEIVPPSPLEVACRTVSDWLRIEEQNSRSTSNNLRQFILSLEQEMTDEELKGFRDYWQNNVVNSGEVPIISGKVGVTQLGASSDAELYPQHKEYLLRMIALAFNLSVRDMNITESDNRATAGVAADVSYQDGIEPIANLINRSLNIELLNRYFPEWEISYSNSEKRSEQEEAARADQLYRGNIITLNEARIAIEQPALDPAIGDKLQNGTSINPQDNMEQEGMDGSQSFSLFGDTEDTQSFSLFDGEKDTQQLSLF
jgi:hypothetical protein